MSPELLSLIDNTESMDSKERLYWKIIAPKMTEEQKQILYKILKNEKDQLENLQVKYSALKSIINK